MAARGSETVAEGGPRAAFERGADGIWTDGQRRRDEHEPRQQDEHQPAGAEAQRNSRNEYAEGGDSSAESTFAANAASTYNGRMDKNADTGFFPLILGGVLIAAVSLANLAATAEISPPTVSTGTTTPNPADAQSLAAPAATQPPIAVQPTARPALPPGQVWHCVVNGQQIFSDSRCGDGASVHILGQLNRMDSTPILPASFYRTGPVYQPPPAYPPPDAPYGLIPPDPSAPEFEGDVYASPQVVLVYERARHEHPSRPHHHHHEPARKN